MELLQVSGMGFEGLACGEWSSTFVYLISLNDLRTRHDSVYIIPVFGQRLEDQDFIHRLHSWFKAALGYVSKLKQ